MHEVEDPFSPIGKEAAHWYEEFKLYFDENYFETFSYRDGVDLAVRVEDCRTQIKNSISSMQFKSLWFKYLDYAVRYINIKKATMKSDDSDEYCKSCSGIGCPRCDGIY